MRKLFIFATMLLCSAAYAGSTGAGPMLRNRLNQSSVLESTGAWKAPYGIVEQDVLLSTGEFQGTLMTPQGILWAITTNAPAQLFRFNTPSTDLTNQTVLNFPNDAHHESSYSITYSTVTKKIYAVFSTFNTELYVSEIDTGTMAYTDVIHDATKPEFFGTSVYAEGNYLYVFTAGTPTTFYKYNLPGFTVAASTTLPAGYYSAQAVVGNNSGTLWAAGAGALAAYAAKVNESAMTCTTSTLPVHITQPADDMCIVGSSICVGDENAYGYMAMINMADLSATEIYQSVSQNVSYGVSYDGKYVWNTLDAITTSKGLQRYNPADGTSVFYDLPHLESNEGIPFNGKLYIFYWDQNPTYITRMNIQ